MSAFGLNDEFVKDSVIVCQDCMRPVYALERGIGPLDRAGRAAQAFRPLRAEDFVGLLKARPDVPLAWQLIVSQWMTSEQGKRTLQANRPKAGDEAICPNCGGCWLKFEERLEGSALDRGYRIILLDIPPVPATGRHRLHSRPDVPDDRPLTFEERHV